MREHESVRRVSTRLLCVNTRRCVARARDGALPNHEESGRCVSTSRCEHESARPIRCVSREPNRARHVSIELRNSVVSSVSRETPFPVQRALVSRRGLTVQSLRARASRSSPRCFRLWLLRRGCFMRCGVSCLLRRVNGGVFADLESPTVAGVTDPRAEESSRFSDVPRETSARAPERVQRKRRNAVDCTPNSSCVRVAKPSREHASRSAQVRRSSLLRPERLMRVRPRSLDFHVNVYSRNHRVSASRGIIA